MEPKCNYCDFFGEKYHCHNCRIFNGAREHVPQEITCSIEEFVQTIENEEHLDEIYEVGDYIYIEAYTGEKLKVVVLDHNKDIIANANGKTAKISLGILDIDGSFSMNPEGTNEGGWTESQMRRRMEKFFRILPESLKSHIVPVVKQTSVGSRSNSIDYTADKLFLFSEIEFFGTVSYSFPGEGEQYEYFKSPENRRLKRYTWRRSPYYGSSVIFCCVISNGYSDYNGANFTLGVAFGFCLGSNI